MGNIDNYLEIMKLGFHGAAIVSIMVTAKLLYDLNKKWGPEADASKLPILRESKKTINKFMLFSGILFLSGIAADLFSRNYMVEPVAMIRFTPSEWPAEIDRYKGMVSISHQDKGVALKHNGVPVMVSDNDSIAFDMIKLVYEVDNLVKERKVLLNQATRGGIK